MNEIKDSIIATGGSKIKGARIDKSINMVKRKSFLKGFLSGVLASLIASVIWHFIEKVI